MLLLFRFFFFRGSTQIGRPVLTPHAPASSLPSLSTAGCGGMHYATDEGSDGCDVCCADVLAGERRTDRVT